jgi:hypothetical protein
MEVMEECQDDYGDDDEEMEEDDDPSFSQIE